MCNMRLFVPLILGPHKFLNYSYLSNTHNQVNQLGYNIPILEPFNETYSPENKTIQAATTCSRSLLQRSDTRLEMEFTENTLPSYKILHYS